MTHYSKKGWRDNCEKQYMKNIIFWRSSAGYLTTVIFLLVPDLDSVSTAKGISRVWLFASKASYVIVATMMFAHMFTAIHFTVWV